MSKSREQIELLMYAENHLNEAANRLVEIDDSEVHGDLAVLRDIGDKLHKVHTEWEMDKNSG